MKYSNELKVGVAIVLAIVIFIVGLRFFQDIPVLAGSYDLFTTFDDAGGLVSGNPVRISGVPIGAVERVFLDETGQVRVRFHVDEGTAIPQGSTTSISGIAAFGSVYLDLNLGPPSNPPVDPGATLPSEGADLLGDLSEQAPELIVRADSLLLGATRTFDEAGTLLANPQGDLRQTLVAIQGSADALERLLRLEQRRIASTLESVDTLATSLAELTTENQDSLAQVVANLNNTLDQLSRNLAALETTTDNLDQILTKVNTGEGTLGLLVNDPGLYYRMDSTLLSLDQLLKDVQQNPKRYLKDLRLVDVF